MAALDFPLLPANGQVYGNYTWDGEKWVITPSASGAPPLPATVLPLVEGTAAIGVSTKYAREDHVHPLGPGGGGGASVLVQDARPDPLTTPVGSLWWESDTGNLYILYNDGDSKQWVAQLGGGGAGGGSFIQTGAGAVTRTMQDKAREVVSVLDFGADPTGATSSKAAFLAAIQPSRVVHIPPGVFDLGNGVSISGLTQCSIIGAGFGATSIRMTDNTGGAALSFPGCHSCNFEEMNIYAPNGSQTFSSGINISGVGNGLSRIRSCWVQGFWYGISLQGDAVNGMSGMMVEDCITTTCDTGLFSDNSEDFHYVNNQWGGNNNSSTGAFLRNSDAGLYAGNYHYSSLQGLVVQTCGYNRYIGNRSEINLHENVRFVGCHRSTLVGNSFFSASIANPRTYNNINFENCDQIAFVGNAMFTWGGAGARAAISLDANCTNISIVGNTITDFSVGPIENNSSNPDSIHISGNLPRQQLGDRPSNQTFSGTTVNVVGANSNVWLGSNGAQGGPLTSVYVVNRTGSISALAIGCSNAPGAGQTYSFEVQKNGSNTGMHINITNAAAAGSTTSSIPVVRGDQIEINLQTSVGAAAVRPRWVLEVSG